MSDEMLEDIDALLTVAFKDGKTQIGVSGRTEAALQAMKELADIVQNILDQGPSEKRH